MKRLLFALLCAILAVSPALADVNYGVTPSNGRPAAGPLNYHWDGTNWIPDFGDTDGNKYVRSWSPSWELIENKAAQTINSAAIDSSALPVSCSAYREMKFLIRVKQASFAAGAALTFGAREHVVAGADSTARGFFLPMGNGTYLGKTKYLVTLNDRWFTIPVTDSTYTKNFTASYVGHWIQNLTGAAVVLDIQLWGLRW